MLPYLERGSLCDYVKDFDMRDTPALFGWALHAVICILMTESQREIRDRYPEEEAV